jgi:hypothetical protein
MATARTLCASYATLGFLLAKRVIEELIARQRLRINRQQRSSHGLTSEARSALLRLRPRRNPSRHSGSINKRIAGDSRCSGTDGTFNRAVSLELIPGI